MIVATILLAIFAGLVIFFGLRGAQTRRDVTRTLPALITFGVLAIMTGLYAFGQYLDAILPQRLEPLESLAQVEAAQPFGNNEMFLLVGETVTYTPVFATSIFEIALTDGVLDFIGVGYQAVNWDETENELRFLDAGEQIVVRARARNANTLDARTIFKGTHDDYLAAIADDGLPLLLTAIASFALGAFCFGAPLWVRRRLEN